MRAGCMGPCPTRSPEARDTVVVHARIYTLSPRQRWAEALAIRDGHILEFWE